MKFDNIAVSGSLRVNYEKFLYPYELCQVNNGVLKVYSVCADYWCHFFIACSCIRLRGQAVLICQ